MRTGLAAPGGLIKTLGSVTAGALVGGLVLAFAGPFLQILAIIGSIIYNTIILLRALTPKKYRDQMKGWNA